MTKEEILESRMPPGSVTIHATDAIMAMQELEDQIRAEYATQENHGWVKLSDQHIEGNPLMLFDDGSICYFEEDWPFAVATHYMPDAPQKPEV